MEAPATCRVTPTPPAGRPPESKKKKLRSWKQGNMRNEKKELEVETEEQGPGAGGPVIVFLLKEK